MAGPRTRAPWRIPLFVFRVLCVVSGGSSSSSPQVLELDTLTQGFVIAPSISTFTLDIGPCRPQGYILVELLSPNLTASQLGASKVSRVPLSEIPQSSNANGSDGVDVSWTESSPVAEDSLLGLISSEYSMPILLLSTEGPPQAQIIRPYSYEYQEQTVPLDFPDYQAQETVQYQHLDLDPFPSGEQDPHWTLGVMSDSVLAGHKPLQFFLHASCPSPRACPGNCGGREQGVCGPDGTCTCLALWGGASCTTSLGNLTQDMGIEQILGPRLWRYYSFEVPPPYANLLLEVRRQCLGAPEVVVFMKPKAEGFLKQGLPTEYDFYEYSDQLAYKWALSYKHILWERAQPGGWYVGVLNGGDSTCNFTVKLQMDTDDSGANLVKLCPKNCSYPNGECVSVENPSSTQCLCDHRYAGPYCEGRLYDATLDSPLSGILLPMHTVYFRLNYQSNVDLSAQLEHQGGNLIVMLGKDGEVPSLASRDVLSLPVISTGSFEKSVIRLENISESGTVTLGLYNSDRFISQNSTIRIQFFYASNSGTSFIQSPYMITVMVLLGVIILGLLGMAFRRLLSRPPPLLTDQYLMPNMLQDPQDASGSPRGIPRDVVQSLPILCFKEEEHSDVENQCAVCLGDYEEGEHVRKLPLCQHIFHVACVDKWLETHDTCPLCRCSLALTITEATQTTPLSRVSSRSRMLESPSRS